MKKTRAQAARNQIGPRVRLARLKSKVSISQEDLAGRLAAMGILIDRSAVSRIESQDRYVMDFEAAAIAKSLGVSVAWLFGETENSTVVG
jgi:HTH-type transcriptional regulator, cell division transcriptional repressor